MFWDDAMKLLTWDDPQMFLTERGTRHNDAADSGGALTRMLS